MGERCTGEAFYSNYQLNLREIMEGKLKKELIAGHTYQFSAWVQSADTAGGAGAQIQKIIGVNSFSVYLSDTVIHDYNFGKITDYTPQIQINKMMVDTQNWMQLVDTFIANGGEKYICLGNFKTDAQIQTQLIDSIASTGYSLTYYFIDDVSLIDLDALGVEEIAAEKEEMKIYPNPVGSQLTVISNQFAVNTIEVMDVLGRVMLNLSNQINSTSKIEHQKEIQIDISDLANGIYFIKATNEKGNVSVGKFVKE
jgi:hypothetical protein